MYKALCAGVITQHDAEEFGRWLRLYRVDVSRLAVYQVDTDGRRHRDNALLKTISDTAGEVALGVGCAPVMMIFLPLFGLIPALGVALGAIGSAAPVSLPALKKMEYDLNKRIPGGPNNLDHTEVEFRLAGVSAERLGWSEYLLGCYAQLHTWDLLGAQHPGQVTAGRNYAARTGTYPRPWSQQPRGRSERKVRKARAPRGWRDWLEDL